MASDREIRLLCRRANRHARDGLQPNDAVLLAFADQGLDLPLSGTDTEGRPEWVGWDRAGELLHIVWNRVRESD